MVLASADFNGGGSGGGEAIPAKVTKTVKQIKEIVCDYSEAEIYAMLKESGMDPNETTQKLLSQDPFHEVKRKRDKKKEQAGHRVIIDTRNPLEHNVHWAKPPEQNVHWARYPEQNMHWAKPPTNWDRNARRGGYNRVPTPGFREFRIVRDNRAIHSDAKPETLQLQAHGSQQAQITVPVKNSAEVLTKQKQSHATNPKRYTQGVKELPVAGPPGVKNPGLSGSKKPLLLEESQTTVSGPTQKVQRDVKNSSNAHAATTSTNSVIGVYSSSSDPVHVPSPDSRTAGTAGAIRREVGVVGVRRQQSSDRSTTHTVVSHKTDPVSSLRKDVALSPAESLRNTSSLSKSSQLNQPSAPSSNIASISNRPFSNNQHNNKLHQQTVGQQKAVARSMEWKPKPSKKSNVVSPSVDAVISCPDNSTSTSTVDATGLSEKLSKVNVVEKEHVIIPQHLRVPEWERTNLTFGSFGDGFERTKLTFGSFGDVFDSSKAFTSAYQATETIDSMNDEPSLSVSTLVTAGSSENAHGDFVNAQESDSPASVVESEQPPSGNNDSFAENVDNYAEIGLVQSHSPPFSSSQPPQLHNASSVLPSYVAYNNQTSYDVPFFRNVMDENIRGQVLSSSSEVLSSHAAISSPPASAAVIQQQSVQQQQQTVPQMYPQLQVSHFPNFMQYRQMISPLYLPQMALQNYPNTPSYPHPSNGSSYVLMPGASPHLTAGGIKYATSQYKPVPAGTPAGYGNFTNPAGFTINAPASIGAATGHEDVTRIKYKDNNLYVPNAQQAESPDIWIQTPREVPGLQSAYYNLPGQAPHPTFMPTHVPTHAGLGSFNASAQSSHVQYPGLYHPTQPGSIPNTHHMVHQQVAAGFGQGVGVGVAGPGPQVGTYQQPQVSHLNWTGNF